MDPSKDYNQSIEQVNRRINTIIHTSVDISRIIILDKKGIVVASSHTDIGQNKSAAEIFLKGKEGVYIGDFHISNFTGNIVISVAAPILVNGKFSGVLIVNYDAERGLFKITTDRTGLGETGEIYLVNKDGYMITPSRFVNNTLLKQKVDTSESRECHELSEEEEEREREEIEIYENYMGKMVLGAHYKIKGMNWCLLAEINEAEAFAPVTMLTHTLLSVLAIVSVLGIILSILLSRKITKPIVKLHQGTEEIIKGNLDYKVGTEARDETGQLSRAFDRMTADLKKSREKLEASSRGLEKKVEERTNELAEKVKESEEQTMATQNLLEDVNETKNELEASRHAILNLVHDLETEKREVESAKEMLEATNVKLERSNKELQDFA
ncbi:MAG: HAMP domain-containing protein, partial [Proteobacteria bacterium]|nr:HAMP domain-containing protein [Pseudomonadota bacterium]